MPRGFRLSEPYRNEKRVQAAKNEKHRSVMWCPECGLVFQEGVWKRSDIKRGPDRQPKLCPACTQIKAGVAGGIVQLGGSFAAAHRQDLLNRIRNLETLVADERPLERIINIKEEHGEIVISATTEHLAARIGKAIQRDFGGELQLKYAPEDKFATARWHRDI
jgi:NMD protein affecting ribosome stability and mRNA decay